MSTLNSKQGLNNNFLLFNNPFLFFCQLAVTFKSLIIAMLPWHLHIKESSYVGNCKLWRCLRREDMRVSVLTFSISLI